MVFSEWLEKKFIEWISHTGKYKSQREFAEWLDMDSAQFNHYLNGRRVPTGDNVHKIASKLGPETYDILGLARPDPVLQYVTRHWHELTGDEQGYIRETVEKYVSENKSKTPGVDL